MTNLRLNSKTLNNSSKEKKEKETMQFFMFGHSVTEKNRPIKINAALRFEKV